MFCFNCTLSLTFKTGRQRILECVDYIIILIAVMHIYTHESHPRSFYKIGDIASRIKKKAPPSEVT